MNSMPLTREGVEERLLTAERDIRALGVARLALFGSVLHGTAQPDSDVNLLVQFASGAKSFDRFVRLCELLEECSAGVLNW